LGTGFPQGNPPSPNQFNICQQIFIYKLEFDNRIEKIRNINESPFLIADLPPLPGPVPGPGPVPVPVPVPVPDPVPVPGPWPVPVQVLLPVPLLGRRYGFNKACGESGKVEAFADDTTPMGKLTRDGILAIKEILTSFATISGLKCNVEKSKILIIGSDLPILEYVLNSGFAVTNTLKILGFDITADKNDLYKNYDKVIDKMRNIVRFWERFRLSLPGRINVAKSLLLSQISYYGSIIPVRNETVSELQSIMNNFISGKMRLSGKQILTSVDKALLM
jgi:hypothetical protein